MTAARSILIATTNPGKLREIRAVMADLPIDWVSLDDLDPLPPPVEDEPTFEGNARKKALYYAARTGFWTLADDSGLEVDALDGAPGVHSARFAGTGNDADNNRKLIAALAGVPDASRTARFRCALALAEPTTVLVTATGVIEGRIIDEPRGTQGFGYDPHFCLPGRDQTTAELPPAAKNRISHRGQALHVLKNHLRNLLGAR